MEKNLICGFSREIALIDALAANASAGAVTGFLAMKLR